MTWWEVAHTVDTKASQHLWNSYNDGENKYKASGSILMDIAEWGV